MGHIRNVVLPKLLIPAKLRWNHALDAACIVSVYVNRELSRNSAMSSTWENLTCLCGQFQF